TGTILVDLRKRQDAARWLGAETVYSALFVRAGNAPDERELTALVRALLRAVNRVTEASPEALMSVLPASVTGPLPDFPPRPARASGRGCTGCARASSPAGWSPAGCSRPASTSRASGRPPPPSSSCRGSAGRRCFSAHPCSTHSRRPPPAREHPTARAAVGWWPRAARSHS